MNLNDVSRWVIFIDDLDGNLCMNKRKGETGRDIEVLATEEVEVYINKLKEELKRERATVDFYADLASYDTRTIGITTYATKISKDTSEVFDAGYRLVISGKLARKTQKQRKTQL